MLLLAYKNIQQYVDKLMKMIALQLEMWWVEMRMQESVAVFMKSLSSCFSVHPIVCKGKIKIELEMKLALSRTS